MRKYFLKYLKDYFNSIKVRLELLHVLDDAVASSFQFHKGTIRTDFEGTFFSTTNLFQFHKGTIRTSRSAFDISS